MKRISAKERHLRAGSLRCRRGLTAMWALVVLAVLSIVTTTATVQLLAARRYLERRHNQVQALWLARSGLELAAERLLTKPKEYEGETMELVPAGEVRIKVQSDKAAADVFVVTSEAHYPLGGPDQPRVLSLTRRFKRLVEKERVRLEAVANP